MMAEEAMEEVVDEQAEQAPAEEPAQEPAEEPAQEQEAADWRTSIEDEDLRKHAERFQNIEDLVRANVDSRKLLSKAIIPPRKNAKEEDIAAYRKATGVPDRIEDYPFDVPEGVEPELFEADVVKDRLKVVAEAAHAANVSSEGFKAIIDAYFASEVAQMEEQKKADEKFAEESVAVNKDKWGPNYDRELEYAKRGLEFAPDEDLEALREIKLADDKFLMDHPAMVRYMNKVGRAMSEDSVANVPVNAEEAQSIQNEIIKLTEEQMDAQALGNTSKAAMLDAKIMELARKKGDGPIVGDGRAA